MKQWTNDFFDQQRLVADPLADATVEKIVASGQVEQAKEVFRLFVTNDGMPSNVPPDMLAYFKSGEQLPSWADSEKLALAADVFARYGPELSMMLLCKSLPASYACWRGAEVLHRTGRLELQRGSLLPFTRRLMETSQFVIDVMAEGGLSPKGRGIRTAQKVRLMHAAIRYFITKGEQPWDEQVYGRPINQEDMTGTLMAFSVYPIDGLAQIGISLKAPEKDALVHCWNVIGVMMGVDEHWLPKNYEEGHALGYAILNHQKGASEAGEVLMSACLAFLKQLVPGNRLDFLPEILVRYLLGQELADMLKVPHHGEHLPSTLKRLAAYIFKESVEHLSNEAIIAKLSAKYSRYLLQGLINYFNSDKQIDFAIPPSLRDSWLPKADEDWGLVWSSPELAGFRIAVQNKYTNRT